MLADLPRWLKRGGLGVLLLGAVLFLAGDRSAIGLAFAGLCGAALGHFLDDLRRGSDDDGGGGGDSSSDGGGGDGE